MSGRPGRRTKKSPAVETKTGTEREVGPKTETGTERGSAREVVTDNVGVDQGKTNL